MKTRRVEEQIALTTIPADALPFMRWADAEQLTCRQAAVLAIVTANPGVTVGAVAAVMGIPKPGVTRAADKLVDWGLMLRSVSRMDRRLVELHAKKAAPARMGRSTRGGG
jgi:DNA-binding MarR family transcriptional regulator